MQVPDNLTRLSLLQTLCLDRNALDEFPLVVCQLRLASLEMSQRLVREGELPVQIGDMVQLRVCARLLEYFACDPCVPVFKLHDRAHTQ